VKQLIRWRRGWRLLRLLMPAPSPKLGGVSPPPSLPLSSSSSSSSYLTFLLLSRWRAHTHTCWCVCVCQFIDRRNQDCVPACGCKNRVGG
jgi:hypothetical protein